MGMIEVSDGSPDRATREVTAILIHPDAPGVLVRVRTDHRSICSTLNATNTEAHFFTRSAAIAWMSADGGEWNLPARGFLRTVDVPAAIGAVSGPVLLAGLDDDGDVDDVPDDLITAARGYGILAND